MTKMNLLQAINDALITSMSQDERVMVFGEDVGHFGGVFRATSNLQEKFEQEMDIDVGSPKVKTDKVEEKVSTKEPVCEEGHVLAAIATLTEAPQEG